MLSDEQKAAVERIASEYGAAKVVPLPELTNMLAHPMRCEEHPVAVCGYGSTMAYAGDWIIVDYSGSEIVLDVYADLGYER